MTSITERWAALRKKVLTLCPHAVLIAVSKAQPAEVIEKLLEAGQRDFGENRVQEAMSKWPALKIRFPDARLHLIGPLQSNKVKQALSLFNVIHTLDRENLADALIRAGWQRKEARCEEFFIQVNTGREPQKGGVFPEDLSRLLHYILTSRRSPLAALPIIGLMCIPPVNEPPAPHFALLKTLADRMKLPCLSMGMSGDYETALRLGATHVRIGTALFGEREGKTEDKEKGDEEET